MRAPMLLFLSCVALAGTTVSADNDVLDCGHRSLAAAVKNADANHTIRFTGVCAGPIVIRRNGLTLKGIGTAVIDGGGSDAVTVTGASRATLTSIEVRNGLNGIVAANGAHLQLTGLNVHDNAVFGISLQTASSAVLADVTTSHNGVHGLDVETGSAATVSGALTASFNRVFGINVNGSAITFSEATVVASNNALGIQIATSANAFINDSATVITANNNLATGLTVVSGAHMVSFGGTINASGNPVNGVSVNSKGGLDLDAATTLNAFNNGDGVVLQEASVMTVFNTPQFSGAPGFSTINAHNNSGTGVRVLSGSTLTLVNQARIVGTQNGRFGLAADNGVGVTLVNSTLTGNTTKDLQLTFGARADLSTLVFGSFTCDATVLVRGTSGITCPH
jgi:parallel beta helix pectate lyase-like protein